MSDIHRGALRPGNLCTLPSPNFAVAGAWLAIAAGGFWLSWLLMPGVGVTDTSTIFALVGQHRRQVYASVILQLLSAAAYAPSVLGLVASSQTSHPKTMRFGCALLLVGAMGSAADAIFHLVAVEMTAPGIDRAAMATVMRRLQGPDLRLLLPFVAALFIGHVVVVAARSKADWGARCAFWLLACSPALAGFSATLARFEWVSNRVVGLTVLGIFSSSLALVGLSMARVEGARSGQDPACVQLPVHAGSTIPSRTSSR
jgi:hypothetical protein